MITNQKIIFLDQGKTNINAVVDENKRQSLDQSTSNPDPIALPNDRCHTVDNSRNNNPIIAEYKNANLNRRLQLYLQFPLLESQFNFINRNDRQLGTSSDFALRVKSFAAQMGMALGSAAGARIR